MTSGKFVNRSGALTLILKVGLIAGTLDIADALIFSHFRGVAPARVFQYITSSLIGMQSFQLSTASVILGIICTMQLLSHGQLSSMWRVVSLQFCCVALLSAA